MLALAANDLPRRRGHPTGSYSLRCRPSVPGGVPTVAMDEAVLFTVE